MYKIATNILTLVTVTAATLANGLPQKVYTVVLNYQEMPAAS